MKKYQIINFKIDNFSGYGFIVGKDFKNEGVYVLQIIDSTEKKKPFKEMITHIIVQENELFYYEDKEPNEWELRGDHMARLRVNKEDFKSTIADYNLDDFVIKYYRDDKRGLVFVVSCQTAKEWLKKNE